LTNQKHSRTPNLLLGFDNALFLNHKLNPSEITCFENFFLKHFLIGPRKQLMMMLEQLKNKLLMLLQTITSKNKILNR
jgi:hypothetical protein